MENRKKENIEKVLIAGIGGASLGTEILKSLLFANTNMNVNANTNANGRKYEIYGCDISRFAYGHYQRGFKKTFVIESDDKESDDKKTKKETKKETETENYINSILKICKEFDIDCIIPGGEEPTLLIGKSYDIFKDEGIKLAINSPDLINKFSDKYMCFKILSDLNIRTPMTKCVINIDKLDDILADTIFPCIIKPARSSGGSNFAFLVNNRNDAEFYIRHLHNNEKIPLLQEYIPEKEGEFTVGVLSLPNEQIVCSIALKRIFSSKLSISSMTKYGLISSGYTQGFIDYFPEICSKAENIAASIKSKGPINIQGRIKDGEFIPFEINVRFSASTYLRTMAGINELDIFLQYLFAGKLDMDTKNIHQNIRPGYYFRSFSEIYVDKDGLKLK